MPTSPLLSIKPIPVKPKVMIQPPPSQVTEPAPEQKPEPAIPIASIPIKTQDQLAAEGIQQQNIRKRNEMVPNESKPHYEFTDADRKEALSARLAKKYDWDTEPLDEALAYLAEIRAEVERGGLALQKRVSELKVEKVKCFGCDNIINLSEGRWATMRTRNNFETGLPESQYACSAACGLKLNREFSHPVRVPTPKEG